MSERIRSREKFKQSSCVFIFLIDGDNILLLLRENTGWMDGYYTVPSGIKEDQEMVHLAAVREAQEEIGVEINPADLDFVHFMDCHTTGEKWYGLYFIARKWTGTPVLKEPHKHKEVRWFPIAELPSKMSPYVLQAISHYKNNSIKSDFGWELRPDSTGEDYVKYYSSDKFAGY